MLKRLKKITRLKKLTRLLGVSPKRTAAPRLAVVAPPPELPMGDPIELWRLHPRGEYLIGRGGDRVAPPITGSIALTNKCNLRCEICGSQKHLDETGTRRRHMDFGKLQAVAETIFPFLITVELNSQGDPLLYPQIEQVLELIGRHGCELKVQTNGTLFTDRVIDIMTRQVGEVNLSLDAVGPKFDEVRRGGVWSKAEPGLKRFLAARDPTRLVVGLYPTVTRRTLGEGVKILDWAAEQNVDTVVFHRYSPIQNSFEEQPSESECRAMQDQLREWSIRNGNRIKVQFEAISINQRPCRFRKTATANPDKHRFKNLYAPACNFPVDLGQISAHPEFTCTSPLTYVEIGLDGQISACCRSQDVSLGDATSVETFADAWFGPTYSSIRESLRRGATGPYPLANCQGCMNFSAPMAAAERLMAVAARPPAIGVDAIS